MKSQLLRIFGHGGGGKDKYFEVCLSGVRKIMIGEMPGDKMLLFLFPSVHKGADLL